MLNIILNKIIKYLDINKSINIIKKVFFKIMPKIKIDYGNMIFYKVYCLNPSVKKIFIGHTTNMVQRKHVLKKQTEVRNLEMFDIINNNGGWKCWRIKEIEKYISRMPG